MHTGKEGDPHLVVPKGGDEYVIGEIIRRRRLSGKKKDGNTYSSGTALQLQRSSLLVISTRSTIAQFCASNELELPPDIGNAMSDACRIAFGSDS